MADLWYFTHGGKQMEPVTAGELKAHATSGFLSQNDLVWKEGMAAWVKASTLKGLFPPGSAAPPSPQAVRARPTAQEVPAVESVNDDYEDDLRSRRRKRRSSREDDVDDDDDRRDIRRGKRSKSGMSGLAIGLIVGGVAAVLLIAIGFGVYFISRSSGGGGIGVVADYNFDIGPNQFHANKISLRSGNTYEFRVNSDQQTDVDLHVFDPQNQEIGFDTSIGPNSFISLKTSSNGMYRVEVRNLDIVQGNHSHVVVKNLGPGQFAVNPFQHPQIVMPNVGQPPQFPKGFRPPQFGGGGINRIAQNPVPAPNVSQKFVLQPHKTSETVVVFPKAMQVHVGVDSDNPANDVDLYVFKQQGRQPVVSDTDFSHTCRVTFMAEANTPYILEVRGLRPVVSNCTLIYTQP